MLLYLNKSNEEYLDRNLQDIDWDYNDDDELKTTYRRDYEEWLDDLDDDDFRSNLLDK